MLRDKEANKIYHRKYYLKNKEKIRAKAKKYYEGNKEACIERVARYKEKFGKEKWSERHKKYVSKGARELKEQTFAAYGDVCACCGEADPKFLSIDHVGNWGSKHRKELGHRGTGSAMYRVLRAQGFPKRIFRLLCFNCNQATRYGQPCPHEKADVSSILRAVAC